MKPLVPLCLALGLIASPAAAFDWTGFNAGVLTGYLKTDANAGHLDAPLNGKPSATADVSAAGYDIGAVLGYNHQLGNGLVFGFQADLSYGQARATGRDVYRPNGLRPGGDVNATTDWTGSVRARVGYAADRFMPYVTAGTSFARVTVEPDYNLTARFSDTRVVAGPVVGAGIDYAVTDNVALRAEYLYSGFTRYTFETPNFPNHPSFYDASVHSVKVGAVFKF